MNILHYSLGFPPYRTGGLTKYAVDLAGEQAKEHSVAMLWPGKIKLFNKTTKIKQRKAVENILNYEIINPLPVPVFGGIKNPDLFLKDIDGGVYRQFFENFKPDIIHIHTLMGLHRQFLLKAKEKHIKLVYTTHDYFGFCPGIYLFRDNSVCETKDCSECSLCNANSMDEWKLFFMQHPIYRMLKESYAVKIARKYAKKQLESKKIITKECKAKNYQNMRKYHIDMFSMIDEFYFNSPNTKDVYCRYIGVENCKIIPIMHKGIKDFRREKKFNGKLKLLYMGQILPYKGFGLLKNALDGIYRDNQDFELAIFDKHAGKEPYIIVGNRYSYNELEEIFSKNDLLIVPSIWEETFGLVVLEALCHGVPVLATNRVGASYLLKSDCGIICEANENSLKKEIREILKDRSILQKINRNILDAGFDFDFENYVRQMVKNYSGRMVYENS